MIGLTVVKSGSVVRPDGTHSERCNFGTTEPVVGLTDAFKPLQDKRGLYALNKDGANSGLSVPRLVLRPVAVAG